MGVEELLAFVPEGADAALLDEALFFGEVPLLGEFLLEESPQLFDEVPARRDGWRSAPRRAVRRLRSRTAFWLQSVRRCWRPRQMKY